MAAFLQHDCGCACATLADACAHCEDEECPIPVVTGGARSGQVGTAFSHYISATNSPTSYGATPLPPGLSLTGNHISGTPTTLGATAVTLSATNACGTGDATLTITIAGPCPLSPTLVCDSVAASLNKCGYSEFPGNVSSPPKMYRTWSWSGSITEYVYNDEDFGGAGCQGDTLVSSNTSTYGGSCTFSAPACEESGGHLVDMYDNGCSANLSAYSSCAALECAPSFTATTATYTGNEQCYGTFPAHKFSGTATETLSNEYTTAQLIANVIAALPSYPGTWDGECEAILDLDGDEMSCSIQRFRYKFQLPDMTGYSAAEITWMEGTTPRSYTWNGSATETGVYTATEPAANGSVEITDVLMTCA